MSPDIYLCAEILSILSIVVLCSAIMYLLATTFSDDNLDKDIANKRIGISLVLLAILITTIWIRHYVNENKPKYFMSKTTTTNCDVDSKPCDCDCGMNEMREQLDPNYVWGKGEEEDFRKNVDDDMPKIPKDLRLELDMGY